MTRPRSQDLCERTENMELNQREFNVRGNNQRGADDVTKSLDPRQSTADPRKEGVDATGGKKKKKIVWVA